MASQNSEEEEIAQRLRVNQDVIVQHINPVELISHMHKILDSDTRELLVNPDVTRGVKAFEIVSFIKRKGPHACSQFLTCLEKEKNHMGHDFIVSLLKHEQYGTEEQQQISSTYQERIQDHRPAMDDIDIPSLVPVLQSNFLLTRDEVETLGKERTTHKQKVEQLFLMIDTKGPLAYGVFAQCLDKEQTHPTHGELFREISGSEPTDESVSASFRKRKLSEDVVEADSISRRKQKKPIESSTSGIFWPMRILEMQIPLKGRRYDMALQKIQHCHHNGQWSLMKTLLAFCGSPDMKVVAQLEKAVSLIFRGEKGIVEKCVRKAWSLAVQIPGNNSIFLKARCEHVLSCEYRYAKDYEEARKHSMNAKYLLFNCERGEDASWANYCDACIQMAMLRENPKPTEQEQQQELKEVEDSFRYAIDCAKSHSSGIDVVRPHSFIRLAQLSLGSTQEVAGVATEENVTKAALCLHEVDVDSLARRSQSLYYLFESDVHKNKGNMDSAIASARKALEIARTDNYAVELHSAESRLQALTIQ